MATPSGQSLVTPEIRIRFLDRVGRSLGERPLELEIGRHRREVAELFRRLFATSHYDVLSVPESASLEDVHRAYEECARVAHPSHGPRLGLAGQEGGSLAFLFERLTEAYLTLSDPDRRRAYDRESAVGSGMIGSGAVGTEGPPGEVRSDERRRLARYHYQVAVSLATSEDYHPAIDLLEQAVVADPRPEYFALLGHCQAKNPHWIRRAIASFDRALELTPGDAGLLVARSQACELMGEAEEARKGFRAALERMPGHPAALAGLERLGGQEATGLRRFFPPAGRG